MKKKKKSGIQLKTLGKIDFSNNKNSHVDDVYSGGIVGLGKKKKKKKKGKGGNDAQG